MRPEPARIAGWRANLLGPSCTGVELEQWLGEQGLTRVTLRTSGAIGYFRGVKR